MTSERAEGHWSRPLTLQKLVTDGLFPSLIRLEEGSRGREEQLSFSSGDIMALQGSVACKGKSVVLAHYMSDTTLEDWTPAKGEGEMYRALILLPIDNPDVANLSICIFVDPSGEVYKRYIKSRFSECNWIGRENELLVALGEDDDLDDIHEYLNVDDEVRRNVPDEVKEKQPNLQDRRPPAVPARREASRRPEEESSPVPPPRPPKPRQTTQGSSTELGSTPPTVPPRRHRQDSQPSDPGDSAPRLPSKGSHALPKDALVRDREQSSVEDKQLWPSGFTFADMAVPGEATYALPPPRGDSSGPNSGKLFKKVKKFIKRSKAQRQVDAEGKNNKSKASGVERKTSFYYNIEVCHDSPDEQRETDAAGDDGGNNDDDSEPDNYEEIDEELVGDLHRARDTDKGKKGPKTGKKTKRKGTALGQAHDKPTMRVRPQQPLPEIPSESEERSHLSPSPHHQNYSGHSLMTPDYGGAVDTRTEMNLSDMSVKELCACLRQCGMTRLADVCEENVVDGSFLHATPKDALTGEPFCLTAFDVGKLQKIRDGWRPNLGS